jgi:hypothetical protein
MIYVRAPTRVGKSFQGQVAALPEGPSRSSLLFYFVTNSHTTEDPEIPVRGETDTVELLSNVVHMTEAQSMYTHLDQCHQLTLA